MKSCMTRFKNNLDKLMIQHQGKYIACDSQMNVLASEWSKDRARTGAI